MMKMICLAALLAVVPCAAVTLNPGQADGLSLAQTGVRQVEAGDYAGAKSNLELAMEMGRKSNNRLVKGTALYGLGALAMERGDLKPALESFSAVDLMLTTDTPEQKQVLAQTYAKTAEALLGADRPDDALKYIDGGEALVKNNAGEALIGRFAFLSAEVDYYRGDYPKALSGFKGALQTTRLLNGNSPAVADICMRIGEIEDFLGNFKLAWDYYYEATNIFEKSLGKNHPHTAMAYAAMGNLARETGDYEYASMLLQKAMDVIETTLGRQHPDHAAISANLGMLYLILDDRTNHAEAALAHALEVDTRVSGERSLPVARDYYVLGEILRERMKLTGAIDAQQKAVTIQSAILGAHHPRTADTMNGLAASLYLKGEYESALDMEMAALGIDTSDSAKDIPEADIADFDNLAALYLKLNDPKRSVDLIRQAIKTEEHAKDANYARRAVLYHDLGVALGSAGDLEGSCGAFQEALKLIRWSLGLENQRTADEYYNVAECQLKLGDADGAEKNYKYFLKTTYTEDPRSDSVIKLLKEQGRWRTPEEAPKELPRYYEPQLTPEEAK